MRDIAARQVQDVDPETISADDDEALVNYILRDINSQYNYNLLDDAQLHAGSADPTLKP